MIGCVMYEMFSGGHQPWSGEEKSEAVEAVLDRKKMNKPKDCPDVIYDVMCECWTFDPNARPNSTQIFAMVRWT